MSLSLSGVLPHSKNILLYRSPVIESWHCSLQELFFGESGIFKIQVGPSSLSSVYPHLIVTHTPLSERAHMWMCLMAYKATFNDWKNQILLNLQNMKQIVLESSEDGLKLGQNTGAENVIFTQLGKGHSMQLASSLLYLWRDFVLSSGNCNYEESRLQMLKTALEKLSEKQGVGLGCHALKEMVLAMKEIDLEDSSDDEYSFNDYKRLIARIFGISSISSAYDFKKTIILMKNMNQLNNWLCQLSDSNFIDIVNLVSNKLPKVIYQDLLEKRSVSVLVEILIKNPILTIKNLSFDLLKKVLIEMLKKDFVRFFENIPIEILIGVLTKIPRDLLEHVLLEMPKNILQELNLTISSVPLIQEIDQCLAEVKIAYHMRKDTLEVEERPIPLLQSLAVTKICQASNRCLVGRGGLSLSSTYVNRINVLYPDLQQEVCDQVRIIVDHSQQLAFGESQGPNYLSELDLLPLASMMSGYEDFIKQTLLKKCVQN